MGNHGPKRLFLESNGNRTGSISIKLSNGLMVSPDRTCGQMHDFSYQTRDNLQFSINHLCSVLLTIMAVPKNQISQKLTDLYEANEILWDVLHPDFDNIIIRTKEQR